MDTWRHLPSYQLERRADLFFSLYLHEVLEEVTGLSLEEVIVPEFPIRMGSVSSEHESHRSWKVDYLLVSRDLTSAFLVELKTEGRSRRNSQDDYLQAAQKAGLDALLHGVVELFRETKAKRKYFFLLQTLEAMGLLHIPPALKALFASDNLRGMTALSREIQLTPKRPELHILYIQPQGGTPGVISFSEFASVLETHKDPLSLRFAESLRQWAENKAGFSSL
jgi:hypothetical protein